MTEPRIDRTGQFRLPALIVAGGLLLVGASAWLTRLAYLGEFHRLLLTIVILLGAGLTLTGILRLSLMSVRNNLFLKRRWLRLTDRPRYVRWGTQG